MENYCKYKESEKYALISSDESTILCFINWINEKYGICLGEFVDLGHGIDEFVMCFAPIKILIAEYYGINLVKLEEERRKMLEEIRENN